MFNPDLDEHEFQLANAATKKDRNWFHRRISADVLRSQCIPNDEALWLIDQAGDFWTRRREMLADSFNEFLQKSLPGRRLVTG